MKEKRERTELVSGGWRLSRRLSDQIPLWKLVLDPVIVTVFSADRRSACHAPPPHGSLHQTQLADNDTEILLSTVILPVPSTSHQSTTRPCGYGRPLARSVAGPPRPQSPLDSDVSAQVYREAITAVLQLTGECSDEQLLERRDGVKNSS